MLRRRPFLLEKPPSTVYLVVFVSVVVSVVFFALWCFALCLCVFFAGFVSSEVVDLVVVLDEDVWSWA